VAVELDERDLHGGPDDDRQCEGGVKCGPQGEFRLRTQYEMEAEVGEDVDEDTESTAPI